MTDALKSGTVELDLRAHCRSTEDNKVETQSLYDRYLASKEPSLMQRIFNVVGKLKGDAKAEPVKPASTPAPAAPKV